MSDSDTEDMYNGFNWLEFISDDLTNKCKITSNAKIERDETIDKKLWEKQPKPVKIVRCVVEPPPKNNTIDVNANIQAEFSQMLLKIDQHYKEVRDKAESERVSKVLPTEEQLFEKQSIKQIQSMKKIIHKYWMLTLTSPHYSKSHHKLPTDSSTAVWNHESDLRLAKQSNCFLQMPISLKKPKTNWKGEII